MYLDIGNDIILNWDDVLIILTEETALKDERISKLIKEGKIVAEGTTEQVKGNNSLEEVFMELIGNE